MIHADHTYAGRYYSPRHALVAQIQCDRPTHGTIAAWAGVDGAGQWDQAGVFSNSGETTAYIEHGKPYGIARQPEQAAVVRISRLPFGFWKISLNGRTVTTRAYGSVWAGVERVDGADGHCDVQVTTT